MNRLVLAAQLVERGALRATPAGLPVLDFSLQHESTLSESGQSRKVSVQLRAVGIGEITRSLLALQLGGDAVFAGFVAAARNGRGLVFHVTTVEPSQD
jgi:primosomal replication protein N